MLITNGLQWVCMLRINSYFYCWIYIYIYIYLNIDMVTVWTALCPPQV